MDVCEGCEPDPILLALRSSKVSIIGSGGTFNVGLDPDPMVVDPMPPPRDLRANSATATFSFTADAGGVTPITVVDNASAKPPALRISIAAKLVLNLDAYASASPLTLINAPAGHLVGVFGTVTFLGSRTATVNYDVLMATCFSTTFLGRSGRGVAGEFRRAGALWPADDGAGAGPAAVLL